MPPVKHVGREGLQINGAPLWRGKRCAYGSSHIKRSFCWRKGARNESEEKSKNGIKAEDTFPSFREMLGHENLCSSIRTEGDARRTRAATEVSEQIYGAADSHCGANVGGGGGAKGNESE
jgi:hypothetical protein